MKRASIITIAILAITQFVACDALHTVNKNTIAAQGSPYELLVVCDQPEWQGALGDSIRSIFAAPIPYLAQREPLFDILRVTERGYSNIVTRHRNILKTVVSPSIDSATVVVQYDLNASPQMVMTIQGGSNQAVVDRLSQNREQIVGAFEAAERTRALEYAEKFGVAPLEELVERKFGFDIDIPSGYVIRNDAKDFLWLSNEYPTASQGVVIYSYPAVDGLRSLSLDDLLKARNKNVAKIPGPSDGSYMTTYADYEPDYRVYRLNGRIWAEMRGLWDVKGDFMGGSFVSYSTINTQTGEVVTIDCYVYSPKLGKRNFMRGLEHLIHSVEFPAIE